MRANLAAVRTLRQLQAEQRPATPAEQAVLARWSGWGAVPAVFDEGAKQHPDFAWARTEAAGLLDADELAAAARNTLNAHYTDAAFVQEIWRVVHRLGFATGRVLEPGAGSGNFIAYAPDDADVVGVELEPVTAAIAGHLYPQARILNESFADTRVPEGSFDLVIGNVPFGDAKLHDRRHNPGGHSIHNHFIIKSLHLVKPGGLVAVVTSAYTMDATGPGARREMAALADLVGAVRLPTGAHRRAAGTEALTDVLVLRRREPGQNPDPTAWERTRPIELDGTEVRINEYFLDHPQHVLGQLTVDRGMYRRDQLEVHGDRDAGPALAAALADIADSAEQRGLTYDPAPPETTGRPAALVARAEQRPDGFLQASPDGTFTQVVDGTAEPYQPPATQAAELRALLRLRDTAVALLEAEAASLDDTDDIDRARAQLNRDYDAYSGQYGPINRFTERRTGRVDPDSGDDVMARIRPPQGGFRGDPYSNVVYALEHFDSSRQTASKADIFTQRVVAPRAPRLGADSPADALAICLDTYGQVRLDEVARLLGVEPDEARASLGTLVFDEPGTDRLVPAPEYLSGQVRIKLAQAEQAAADDPRYAPNVTALAEVIPPDLMPDQIQARLGATWIDKRYVQQFLEDILQDPTIRVEHPGGSMWTVKSDRRRSVAATSQWGTGRVSAPDIAQALLEQRQIRVTDETDDGKRIFNAEATLAAQAKADEMTERFGEWVWEDPQRAADLARTYNHKFNGLVLRSYDTVELSLPGLAVSFKPRPHQVAAVARVIAEPSVGLWHEVGAGKTAEMAMAAMELRRLGLVRKPAIVVPNHMLAQFSSEFLQLYPQAKILAGSTETLNSRDKRRQFQARCATGDWDAVIITRSAFERIPMSPEVQKNYMRREIDTLDAAIERARAADEQLSLKRLEAMKLRTEERLKAKLDGAKDPGITFEQTGIDYVLVDEAHGYKNLRTPSNIPNMSVDGSQRASDLDMKLGWLRERYDRVATLATATPIANSMGETYTMLRYLRPDLLDELDITDFDSFAATFGELVTAIEVAPDGGMRMNTRFAKFVNVPELLRPWNIAGDVKTAEDLNLPVPAQAPRPSDGERLPETVVVAPSEELKAFIATLAKRADDVRNRVVEPQDDNMLKISSEGRAAALDLRLVGQHSAEPGKVDVAADTIAGIYAQHAERIYPGPDGQPHPTPGALQIVFADLGTPHPDRWNVYDELRAQLVERGVPRDKVRFIHEARNDKEKGDLFAAARDGRVAVLIGSTERMGVGTNVQLRAVALHHLDCPWRPADLQQREGRILRQGNANDEVRILRYVTEGSFDGYSWQTVTRKAQFIAQVMRGKLDVREIEDIGDNALSYNEVKALATGNPLLLDHAQAQAQVTKLERLERAHLRNQDTLRWTIRDTTRSVDYLTARVEAVDAAAARLIDTSGDAFAITLDGQRYTKRTEANEALKGLLTAQMADQRIPAGRVQELGTLGGFTVAATVFRDPKGNPTVRVELLDVPLGELSLSPTEVAGGSLVTRLENRLSALPTIRGNATVDIDRRQKEIARAAEQLEQPFRHADALQQARAELDELTRLIAQAATPAPAPAAAVPDTGAAAAPDVVAPPAPAPPADPPGTAPAVAVPAAPEEAAAAAGEPGPDPVPSAAPPDGQPPADEPPADELPPPEQPPPPAQPSAPEPPPVPEPPSAPEPAVPDGHDPWEPFTPAERALIAHAAEDWAATYLDGDAGADVDDAARQVAERHLQHLTDGHPAAELAAAVTAHLQAHPEVAAAGALTEQQRAERQAERAARARQLAGDAWAAFTGGDLARARELAARGELADPLHQPGGASWTQIRDRIGRAVAAPRPAADAPAASPSEADRLRTRAAVLEHLHDSTDRTRPGMAFHRDDHPARPVRIPDAVDLFSRMVDRVSEVGSAPAHLTWNGVPITVGRTDDQGEPRLRITVGSADGQVEIPLQKAWPARDERGALLRRLTEYIDGAGDRAAGLRTRAAALDSGSASPAATAPGGPADAGPAMRPGAARAFPGRPAVSAAAPTSTQVASAQVGSAHAQARSR